MTDRLTIICGDALAELRKLPDESVQCCVTSPPYWGLRDYGTNGQLGLEKTPEQYVAKMVEIFREVRRVLRKDGTLWLNLGDSYASGKGTCYNPGGNTSSFNVHLKAENVHPLDRGNKSSLSKVGLKPKDLIGIPWLVAFALRSDGWWLRSDVIWSKTNCMPESVQGSHFSRHLVTVEEYEDLSGLQYAGERAGDDWAGDMPNLSEIEVPMRKAPLSAERQRKGDGSCKRTARRCEGETKAIQSLETGKEKQSEIRSHSEGNQNQAKGDVQISGESESQTPCGDQTPNDERSASEKIATQKSEQEISRLPQGQSIVEASVRSKEGSEAIKRESPDSTGLAGNSDSAQTPMSLLPEEEKIDNGSHHSANQGGSTHEVERGSGVSTVQQREKGQDLAPLLVGCPGCPKCLKYHGYIFHLSAGRPTRSHEYLFLLSKSAFYLYDAESIKEPASESDWESRIGRANLNNKLLPTEELNGIRPVKYTLNAKQRRDSEGGPFFKNAEDYAGKNGQAQIHKNSKQRGHSRRHAGFNDRWDQMDKSEQCSGMRNKRDVWTVAPANFPEAHFATYPPDLIKPCVLAGTRVGDTVLDPFAGSGTTGQVAIELGRKALLIELNPKYIPLIENRCDVTPGLQLA
jgi:DNA modification methylase